MTLACLLAALVAIGPAKTDLSRSKDPAASGRPPAGSKRSSVRLCSRLRRRVVVGDLTRLAADIRHSSGDELSRRINEGNDGLNRSDPAPLGVVVGDSSRLAADVRHSSGDELARRINEANDGLNRREPAALQVVVGDLSRMAADFRHSRGAETIQRINRENDGLTELDGAAHLRRSAERRPRLVGWTLLGWRVAVLSWQRFGPEQHPLWDIATTRQRRDLHRLAASGWSGCTAYSSDRAEFASSIALNGPANASRKGSSRLVHAVAAACEAPEAALPVLERIAAWADRSQQAWTAALLRTRTAHAREFGPDWRSAKTSSWDRIGL